MSLNQMITAIERERALNTELRDKLISYIDADIDRKTKESEAEIASLIVRRDSIEAEFAGRDAALMHLIDSGEG